MKAINKLLSYKRQMFLLLLLLLLPLLKMAIFVLMLKFFLALKQKKPIMLQPKLLHGQLSPLKSLLQGGLLMQKQFATLANKKLLKLGFFKLIKWTNKLEISFLALCYLKWILDGTTFDLVPSLPPIDITHSSSPFQFPIIKCVKNYSEHKLFVSDFVNNNTLSLQK